MQRIWPVPMIFLICSMILLAGCSGSSAPAALIPPPIPTPTPVSIAVNVSTSSNMVQLARTLQFTANVTGNANQSVVWAVNGIIGGNSTTGTINTSGLFTAPNSVPNPNTVTVSATSVADSTKSGSIGIQIIPPPSPAGTWSRIAPFGGIIGNVTVDPRARNIIYVTAFNSGVFKSTDSGQTWAAIFSPAESDVTTSAPSSIAVGAISSTLYFIAGAPPNAMTLFTSTNGGATASKRAIPSGIPGPNLAIDPKNDSILYLYGQSGIAKSTDGGVNWNGLANAPQNVNALKVNLQTSTVIYAGTNTGFFKSTDSGTTWSVSNTGISVGFTDIADIALDSANSSRLFIGANDAALDGEIFVSSDNGATWTQTPVSGWPGRAVSQLQLSAASPSTLYAAVNPIAATPSGPVSVEAVYKSTDAGVSWQATVSGLPLGQPLNHAGFLLANNAPDILLYGSSPELFRSGNGASSWAEAENGISGMGMDALAFDSTSSTIYAGATNNGGLWKSSDQGNSWTKLLGDSIFAVAVDPHNSLHLLASDFQQFLLQSTNGGSTWQQVATPIAIIQSIAFSPTQSGLVLACSPNGGIARSTDNAVTWTVSNSGLQTTACRKIAFDSAGNIVAATPSGIYRSANAGSTWTLKKAATDQFGFFTTAIDPTNPQIIFAADDNFYLKSTDGGTTWTTLAPGFIATADPAIAIDPFSHTTVYVSSFGSNVAVSTDSGLTWAPVSNGLGFAQVQDLLAMPGSKLFAATFNNGILAFQ